MLRLKATNVSRIFGRDPQQQIAVTRRQTTLDDLSQLRHRLNEVLDLILVLPVQLDAVASADEV